MKKLLFGCSLLIISSIILYLVLGSTMNKAAKTTADGTNDYAVILGAKVKPGGIPSLSLQYRLDAAVAYLQQYPHVTAIVSGGQGHDEDRTEASVMFEYLVAQGIASERIIQEVHATSTYENLKFSKALLPDNVTSVTIISNDFHLKRARVLAKKLSLEADVVAAKTPKVVEQKSRFRERAALLKTYLFGK